MRLTTEERSYDVSPHGRQTARRWRTVVRPPESTEDIVVVNLSTGRQKVTSTSALAKLRRSGPLTAVAGHFLRGRGSPIVTANVANLLGTVLLPARDTMSSTPHSQLAVFPIPRSP
jgi:hypothetical protein